MTIPFIDTPLIVVIPVGPTGKVWNSSIIILTENEICRCQSRIPSRLVLKQEQNWMWLMPFKGQLMESMVFRPWELMRHDCSVLLKVLCFIWFVELSFH